MRPCRLAEQCCFPRHLLVVEIPPDSGEFPPIGGWHRLERWVAPIGKMLANEIEGGRKMAVRYPDAVNESKAIQTSLVSVMP